jgi:hypothetical protein
MTQLSAHWRNALPDSAFRLSETRADLSAVHRAAQEKQNRLA